MFNIWKIYSSHWRTLYKTNTSIIEIGFNEGHDFILASFLNNNHNVKSDFLCDENSHFCLRCVFSKLYGHLKTNSIIRFLDLLMTYL